MVLNSLSFCLSVKLLISPSYMNEILAGYSNLAVGYFLSSLQVCLAIPSWLEVFLLKDQLLSLWEFPCVIFVFFSLAAFKICSLCLLFVNLFNMHLGVFCFGCELIYPFCVFSLEKIL